MAYGKTHTLAYWQTDTYVPALGEICKVSDYNNVYKVGDGRNNFSGLQFKFRDGINSWFSISNKETNVTTSLCTFYAPNLLACSFIQEGSWSDFKFAILPANNANVKNAYVKFANSPLLIISVPINSAVPILISGRMICNNFKFGNVYYEAMAAQGTAILVSGSGTLTGINLQADNKLLLQGQGVASGDISSGPGTGTICIVSRF